MSETTLGLPLVVLCASAGGLEALSHVLGTLPTPFPAPIVIAQHRDRVHASYLGEILAHRSRVPVVMVREHEQLQPGTAYIIPAGGQVQFGSHDITVRTDGAPTPHPCIDLLLTNAAAVYGKQLIAVILTGTGSDGTVGGRAVHEAGGTVVIQNPATAAYPGMPASLAPATVDFVADLPQIGPLLYDLLTGAPGPARSQPARATRLSPFMPNPELFAVLRSTVLPELIAAAPQQAGQLRLWVAECGTGEVAYGLAILVCELLGKEFAEIPVRIFATDRDAATIAFARRRVYPATAITTLPANIIGRYFTAHPPGYAVGRPLRNLLTFGVHDLARQAPFPRIDLVLCSGAALNGTPERRERTLQLFAYALREGGYLILPGDNTIQPPAEFFIPHPALPNIYLRQGTEVPALRAPLRAHPPVARPAAAVQPGGAAAVSAQQAARHTEAAWNTLVRRLPVGVVVVDAQYAIQEMNDAARRLLAISPTEIDPNFLQFTTDIAHQRLRTAIDRTLHTGEVSELAEVNMAQQPTDVPVYLQITCCPQPAAEDHPAGPAVLILLTDITPAVIARQEQDRARAAGERNELEVWRAQGASEEAEWLNDELQAANAELDTFNRELRATIDELYTSNRALAEQSEELWRLTAAKEALQHRLLHGVIQAQENERQRVARELHDDLGQTLTGLMLTLDAMRETLPEPDRPAQQLTEEATRLAENVMTGLRRVITDLRPPVLDDLGLVPAVRRLAADVQERTGMRVSVQADEDHGRLPPAVELTLFRVAQEALANIVKHAHAHQARIVLRFAPGWVTLRIRDDGQGLPPGVVLNGKGLPQSEGHFGLLGMQERVELLHGVFAVKGSPQRGMAVRVELPLDTS